MYKKNADANDKHRQKYEKKMILSKYYLYICTKLKN